MVDWFKDNGFEAHSGDGGVDGANIKHIQTQLFHLPFVLIHQDVQLRGWMDGWIGGWMGGWMSERMAGWMKGWVDG